MGQKVGTWRGPTGPTATTHLVGQHIVSPVTDSNDGVVLAAGHWAT